MRPSACFLSVIAIIAGLVGGSEASAKKVPPPSLPELSGVWLGGVAGGLEYFRLDLGGDGTGNLTIQYLPNEAALAYHVTSTALSAYDVSFSISPIDADAEAIFLRGKATGGSLALEVGGTSGQWRRSVLLEREDVIKGRMRSVEERARRLTKPQ